MRQLISVPFARMTMIDAVKEYSGVDFGAFMGDTEKAKEVAKHLTGAFGISFGDILQDGRKDGCFKIDPPNPSSIFSEYEVYVNEKGEIYEITAKTEEEGFWSLFVQNTNTNKKFISLQLAIQEKYSKYYTDRIEKDRKISYWFGEYKKIELRY